MKVKDLIKLNGVGEEFLADGEREIEAGYAGDFLSFVMSNAPAGAAWFTVMNNVNVAAVAALADVACVVLCEGVKPDAHLSAAVRERGINLLTSNDDIFSAIKNMVTNTL
jgi:hypothetical protein